MSQKFDRVKAGLWYIVVHHTASESPLLKSWNPFNYEFPEYDFGVDLDGKFYVGRPLTYAGAHCQADYESYKTASMNLCSIGFVLAGSFDKRKVADKQLNEAAYNIKRIAKKYKIPLDIWHIIPHYAASATFCPGKDTIWRLYKKLELCQ